MKQPETLFSARVRRDLLELQRLGLPIWFTKIQQVAIRGIPDYILVVAGIGIGLELKRSSKQKADPLQQKNLDDINKCGGIGWTVCPETWPEALIQLKKIASRRSKRSWLS